MTVGIDLTNQPAFGDLITLGLAANAAERIGYTSVWVPLGDRPDSVMPAAAAAATTDDIQLGIAVDTSILAGRQGDFAALARVAGDRTIVAVPDELVGVASVRAVRTVLVAGLPRACSPSGAAGWSPRQPALGDLVAGPGLLVPRVQVRISDAPLSGTRPDWHGSLRQVSGDIVRAFAAGATEMVIALHDQLPFDAALERWALLAEAVDLAKLG